MTLDLVLSIIDGSIKLANQLVEAMTPEERASFAQRHEARMQRWELLGDKLQQKQTGVL